MSILIDPNSIPQGQALKSTAQLWLGAKAIKVPDIVKSYVTRTGLSLGHTSERQTVVHLLKTLALNDKGETQNNECMGVNGCEPVAMGVQM